mmetsp:Transcript_28003/g.30608  ORF Transcript_28003/g.30608 Transcript_28003/m.30608 type:complete len:112 (-) Transcript_28003:21-356(-)
MDEDAKKRDWDNWQLGEGYQARGVIRQRIGDVAKDFKILDMTKQEQLMKDGEEKKRKKEIKAKKVKGNLTKTKRKESRKKRGNKLLNPFNPLIQLLVSRISDQTMSFRSKQ